MPDSRVEKLAELVVRRCISVKPGERVVIFYDRAAKDLVLSVMEEVFRAGGTPFFVERNQELFEVLVENADGEEIALLAEHYTQLIHKMDCYIEIEAPDNLCAMGALNGERRHLYQSGCVGVFNKSRSSKKWLSMIYPSKAMAQLAGMETEKFRDYYFSVTNIDYEKLGEATEGIRKRMCEAQEVHVIGKDTDLHVSLKGFEAITANGFHNLPDGEIASTPARDGINGVIRYNVPSLWNGFVFENIRVEFKNGHVVHAVANDTERFLEEIGIDLGSSHVGEFSLGTNPYIDRHITNIIFDEKMYGSLHMALGAAYAFPGRDNGNRSHIHWDLVHSHLPRYGGGEIWMDGELIRKDGIYLPSDLRALNPGVFIS